MQNIRAEVRLGTRDLRGDLPFFTKELGMRLERIFPADNPRVAVVSGHGLRLRLDQGVGAPGTIAILANDPVLIAGGARELVSPGGTRVEIGELDPPVVMPPTAHAFVVRRLADQAPWVIGRAGMQYRDLIPSRLGGAVIASHIRIPDGGPVPDMVHFHKVGFQLIFCYKGWVDVVYEDQGPPIRLTAGDCFIQPPEIRHRVLLASDGIEVIEIGVPAEHITEIEHEMTLPTPHVRPEREWQGQRFVHNVAAGAKWFPFRLKGFEARDTTIAANTKGVANVQVVRKGKGSPEFTRHDADILFGFVMNGKMTLEGEGQPPHVLSAGDAFVTPPGMRTCWSDPSEDVEILEVALPGSFATMAA
ncbi:MAG: cupin domain-containing protein [Rhodobacteraceae bacterium]|nr:cupin domain-containing protein [Paracoccaceae bacterium]